MPFKETRGSHSASLLKTKEKGLILQAKGLTAYCRISLGALFFGAVYFFGKTS